MNIAAYEYGIAKLQKVCEWNKNSPEPINYGLITWKALGLFLSISENKEPKDLTMSVLHESLIWYSLYYYL